MARRKDDSVYTPRSVGVGVVEGVEIPISVGVVVSTFAHKYEEELDRRLDECPEMGGRQFGEFTNRLKQMATETEETLKRQYGMAFPRNFVIVYVRSEEEGEGRTLAEVTGKNATVYGL